MRKLSILLLGLLVCSLAYGFTSYNVQVVAKTSLTGQTLAIATTTVFTPEHAGDFRVSVYATKNAASGGFSCGAIDVSWTDEYSSSNRTVQFSSGGPFAQNTTVIHSAASSAITFDTASCSGTTYDIFVTVEKL